MKKTNFQKKTILFTLIILASPLGWTVGVWNIACLMLLSFCIVLKKHKLWINRCILLIAYITFSVLFCVYVDASEFIPFQFLRTGAPFILFMLVPFVFRDVHFNLNDRYNVANSIVLLGIVNYVSLKLSLPISSVAINLNAGGIERIYLIPFTCFLCIGIFYLYNKKYVRALICCFLLMVSGGRTQVVLIIAALFVASRASMKSIIITLIGTSMIFALIFYFRPEIIMKFSNLLQDERFYEIGQGLSNWLDNTFTIIFGKGFGTPVSNGLYAFNHYPGAAERLYENSRFDIHNLFAQLLPRLGVLGILYLMFILWKDSKALVNGKTYLFNIFLLGLSTGSVMTSPDGLFFSFVWYFLFYKKIEQHDLESYQKRIKFKLWL